MMPARSFLANVGENCGELLGVSRVRLYHDQAFYKEPEGGITPWHADQFYWPLSDDRAITAWVPLQKTPLAMGPIAFAAGAIAWGSAAICRSATTASGVWRKRLPMGSIAKTSRRSIPAT